ncbi:MAG: ATP-binding protein [Flavobacteriales bacterium]|nr:ATP-binding protein [Flavobacteriales bacterium]
MDLPDLWEGRYLIEIAALGANDRPIIPGAFVQLTIRPPWYRSVPAITLGVLALLLMFFLGVRWFLRRRLRIERERSEREQDLLRERIRIAQDLHDDLGSSLALIGMESELARMDVSEPGAREALRKVSDGAREVTDNMRRIVWALGSGQDTMADLVAYIRSSAAELLDRAGIELETRIDLEASEAKLSVDQRRHLLLISKEMLLNAVKHSAARRIELEIAQRDGRLHIMVRDDGRGFDPGSIDGTGTGTISMRARAVSLGGHLSIQSQAGHGTTVKVDILVTVESV